MIIHLAIVTELPNSTFIFMKSFELKYAFT